MVRFYGTYDSGYFSGAGACLRDLCGQHIPVCGGKGWVDDGMHGGQTAECGNCTTNGGNGEWNQLAYDEVEVEEEIHETCPRCGGNGKVPCEGCNGTGVLAPPEQ